MYVEPPMYYCLSLRTSFAITNAWNIYQINSYQHLIVKYKFNNNQSAAMFNDLMKKPNHRFSANFSDNNYILKNYFLNSSKHAFSV